MPHVTSRFFALCQAAAAAALIGGSALAAPNAYETLVLDDNPFLYYRFGESSGSTLGDSGPSVLDGTYVGGPALGSVGAGASGDTAATFNGAGQYGELPAGGSSFGSLMGTASFEFVFSTLETPADATTALFGSANTGGTTNLGIGFNERADGSARLFMRDEDGTPIGGYFINTDMFDGGYHHLLFTYDNTGIEAADRMKAYLDGVEQALTFEDNQAPVNFIDFEFPLTIGANNNRGTIDRFLDGTIDELAVYNTVLSGTDAFNRYNALGIVTPNQWNIDGSGSFNTAENWLDNVVPTDNALFGSTLASGDATVTIDSAVSLNSVTFSNASNQYTLAGPNALTLTGDAEVSAAGSHTISADIAGSAGLVKSGSGVLTLDGAKSYTGETNVQAGTLLLSSLDSIDNQASGSLNIEAGATATFNAGASGTLAAQLTGASTVDVDAALRLNDAVTISRSNAGFGGVIRVDAGTLTVGSSNALGDGGNQNDRTVVQQGTTAKIALPGGVTVASEVIDFEGRSTDDPGLTSSGANTWNGVIRGEGSNADNRGNIESTSGTLTLNELFAEDTAEPYTFVFSGAGTTSVTARISDADIDIDSGIVTVKANDNVGVTKRGSGTLRIDYASAEENDYWFGPTLIEEGTVRVAASSGTVGELRTSSITIEEDGTLDVSAYTEYTQQIGQALRGSGSINVGSGNLRLIDVSTVAPGNTPGAVGELTVTSGTVTLPDLALGGGGVWAFDIGNIADPSGDLLNVQSGAFTGTSSGITINVTAARGELDAGSYTIVSHTGGTNPTLNGVSAQITDASGNALTTRQSVSVSGATSGQVNVVVSGEEASRTWSGASSNAWDVTSNNWQGGDSQFRDLDHVTFDDSASTTDVTIAAETVRAPGSITFANSTPYSITGEGAIVGSGPINVTGTGEVSLANSGNNFTGATTIDSGSSLRMASASTGSITNSGTLSLGVQETIDVLVQNGAATIGSGAYKVFAYEAEDFQSATVNDEAVTAWTVRNDIVGSSGAGVDGEALYASELGSDGSNSGSTATRNFVTYNMKFTEPGSYEWFFHMVSTDGGNGEPTPNGDPGDDDSFWTVTADMDSNNADPAGLGTRVDNFGSGRLAAEGVIVDGTGSLVYDWYRNGTSGSNANEFHKINVTQADVDAGTVFSFKVGTREGGLTLDKFVFVADPDFDADGNFGTLEDADLDGAVSVSEIQDTFTAAGTVLDVRGDFTMADGSTLNLLVSTPGTHDQINVNGVLAADGTLSVDIGGAGFAAGAGDVFDVFTFDSASGSFDEILLPTLGNGYWDTANLLVTGELQVLAIDGDFNGDGVVNAADYSLWRDNEGGDDSLLAFGSSDGSGLIDRDDYDLWAANYGHTVATFVGESVAVPEPASAALLAAIAAGLLLRRGHQD